MGRCGHSQIRSFSPFFFTPRGGWIPIGRQVRDSMPCHRLISRLRSLRFLFVKNPGFSVYIPFMGMAGRVAEIRPGSMHL